MNSRYQIKSFLLTLFIFGLFQPVAYAQKSLRVCDDAAEWPPYIYYKRDGDVVNKKVLVGAAKELMDRIFAMAKINYSVTLLPWKRCLSEVRSGTKYEIVSDGSSNKKRVKAYLRSKPIYATLSGIFYSKTKFPHGVKAKTAKDLNQYRICGVAGYNYDKNFALGMKRNMDTGAAGDKEAIKKVSMGRCDIFPSAIEPLLGAVTIHQFSMPNDIAWSPFPGAKPIKFYLWISRNSPRAKKLLTVINTNIAKLQANGEAKKIFKKYLPVSGSRLAN